MSTRRVQRPGRFTVSRDTLSFLGGWALMIYEAHLPRLEFNLAVFLGGMVIAGIPGAAQALMLWLGARTPSAPLPSPDPVPLPDSSG